MGQIADSSFSGDVLIYSFLSTAILVALHLAAPYIRRSGKKPSFEKQKLEVNGFDSSSG